MRRLAASRSSTNINITTLSNGSTKEPKASIALVIQGLKQHKDHVEELVGVIGKIRQLLASDEEDMRTSLLDSSVFPLFLQTLIQKPNSLSSYQLQSEALGCFSELVSSVSESIPSILRFKPIPILVSLLDSSYSDIASKAIYILGNIAEDGPQSVTEEIISIGGLQKLLACIKRDSLATIIKNTINEKEEQENSEDDSIIVDQTTLDPPRLNSLRVASYTLSYLCSHPPQTQQIQSQGAQSSLTRSENHLEDEQQHFNINEVLHVLRILLHFSDTEILSYACWAISRLCDGTGPYISDVVEKENVCELLIQFLEKKSSRIVKPALRAIGNIVCCEENDVDYTEHIVSIGAVPKLCKLINHPNREIQKEACWTISNIAAGKIDQVQAVIDSGAIPALLDLSRTLLVDARVDCDVRIEARWALLNSLSCGSLKQVEQISNYECMDVLCSILSESETSMVMMALDSIEKLVELEQTKQQKQKQQKENMSLNAIDPSQLLVLTRHRVLSIAKRALALWTKYFVVCTICALSFTIYSGKATFCTECKCYVCKSCNCTVFHLSYQDQLWQEEEQKERDKKDKKKQKKKNNKKKKTLVPTPNPTTTTDSAARKEKSLLKKTNHNQHYVQFLLETNSILALADELKKLSNCGST